jgi:hypothetical protein
LTADTAEQFDHRCQTDNLCARASDALADRLPPAAPIAASAEITAFCRNYPPVAKGFDARWSILATPAYYEVKFQ